jgi:hypothetical protein
MSAFAIPCAASASSTRRVRAEVSASAAVAVRCLVVTPKLTVAVSFGPVTEALPTTVIVRWPAGACAPAGAATARARATQKKKARKVRFSP